MRTATTAFLVFVMEFEALVKNQLEFDHARKTITRR
jgi:hypothetical protein